VVAVLPLVGLDVATLLDITFGPGTHRHGRPAGCKGTVLGRGPA
jgi:hypothetical protein